MSTVLKTLKQICQAFFSHPQQCLWERLYCRIIVGLAINHTMSGHAILHKFGGEKQASAVLISCNPGNWGP